MALHVFKDVEQRSDAWHALRRGIVTASAVGKLITPTLKVADNDHSRGLTTTLAAERITGYSEPSFINDDMFRGISHEPYARDIYSGHYQQAVECGFIRQECDGWILGYSPDGLIGSDGLLEVKCPRAKGHIRTILAGEVPLTYMAQCQAGLLASGRKWIDYVSFCAGLPMFVRRVEPDPQWFEVIEAACRTFEENVQAMVADYEKRTEGMPKTERLDLEVVI